MISKYSWGCGENYGYGDICGGGNGYRSGWGDGYGFGEGSGYIAYYGNGWGHSYTMRNQYSNGFGDGYGDGFNGWWFDFEVLSSKEKILFI